MATLCSPFLWVEYAHGRMLTTLAMAQIRKGVPLFDFGTVQTVLKKGLTMAQKYSPSRAFARV
jgi:hypothetical protein